jgi:heme ABC exporter ATP-binding subunit CcmA
MSCGVRDVALPLLVIPSPRFHVITARNVRKVFGQVAVLESVTLDVAPGECVALLGANGAGKSTFLKLAATITRPTSGSLHVLGHDIARFPERARGHIGLVAHGAHLWDDLTALENLKVWRTLADHPSDEASLRQALAVVELEAFAGERARSFSAGMKRRLSLARFVDAPVRVLLLDEPFSGLDQRGKKWLAEFLGEFKARGGAVLMATHNFERSLDIADRFAILAAGSIALDRPRGALDRGELDALYALATSEGS